MAPAEIWKTAIGVVMFVAVAGISRMPWSQRPRMLTHTAVIVAGGVTLLLIDHSTAAWLVVPLYGLMLFYLAAFSWRKPGDRAT